MAQTRPARIGPESGKAPDQIGVAAPGRVSRRGRDGSRSHTIATASPAKLAPSSSAPRSVSARVCHVLAEDPDGRSGRSGVTGA
jgi:hypothetical protein